MAATTILCSRPCSLQNPDKTYTDGMFYVYQSLARFTPKGGGAKLDLTIEGIQGEAYSVVHPIKVIGRPAVAQVCSHATALQSYLTSQCAALQLMKVQVCLMHYLCYDGRCQSTSCCYDNHSITARLLLVQQVRSAPKPTHSS